MEAYTYLAEVYDTLMADVDEKVWAVYIDSLLRRYGAKRVFDAACGTGSISRELEKLGYQIIAADNSQGMLKAAQEAARRAGSAIQFIRQDMRDIAVGNAVDAVVSTCDGVNYIDEDGAAQFALSAYNAIKPGGVLLFDISTRRKLIEQMDGELFYDDSDDAACIWSNEFDEQRNALVMDVTLFVRRGTLFERLSEQHVQYAHYRSTLTDIMHNAGFSQVIVYDCFTMDEPQKESARIQFVCVKPTC